VNQYSTGIYKVINTDGVFIRREPRIADSSKSTNRVGKLTLGTERRVYDFVTDKLNVTWGRVSESDAAGVAEWVCVHGLNRTYLEIVKADPSHSELLEVRVAALEARVAALESGTKASTRKVRS
jgi:hypothetical protein